MTGPVPVAHVERGDGPALLLSASLGATASMWTPQVEALARHFRVIAYDTRGHGDSPVPPGPYDIADLGADVIALLDRLEVRAASFVGLSLGGMVGMWLAAHAPHRVGRLALLCTSAHMPPATAWEDRASTVLGAGTTAAVADAVVRRWVTPRFAARHPEVTGQLRQMIAGTPAVGYAACCGAIGRMDLRDDLGRITAPTLVVGGADDPATPVEAHARTIADRVAGARLEVVRDAAHLASVEQPGRVTELLIEHLTAEEDG